MNILRYFAVAAILFLSSIAAVACSCVDMGAGVCQTFWVTPAVFSGRVVEISDVPRGEGTNVFLSKRVKFAIIDAFRGVTGETVDVLTGSGGGDCGYRFEMNESYLVYGWKNDEGNFSTGICSRTRKLSDAVDDLAYIRGLADAKPGGSIYGRVNKYLIRKSNDEYKPNPPLANIPVFIEGEKARFETFTDASGMFRVDDIPAGKYTVTAKPPPGFSDRGTKYPVELFDKGCATVWLVFEVDTFLSGRVTDQSGQPVKLLLNLVPVETINAKHQPDHYVAETDANGRYIFREAPDGKYYLGVRLSNITSISFPYPKTFYPGVTDITRAAVIEIHEGVGLQNYDLQLPPKLASRTVSGKIIVEPGVSIKAASFCLEEREICESTDEMQVKPDGSFKFTVFNGVKYVLRAFANTANGQRFAKPIEIPETGDVLGLKVVVDQTSR